MEFSMPISFYIYVYSIIYAVYVYNVIITASYVYNAYSIALGPRQQSVKIVESGLSAVKLEAQRYTCTSVGAGGIGNRNGDEVRWRKHSKGKNTNHIATAYEGGQLGNRIIIFTARMSYLSKIDQHMKSAGATALLGNWCFFHN